MVGDWLSIYPVQENEKSETVLPKARLLKVGSIFEPIGSGTCPNHPICDYNRLWYLRKVSGH